MQYTLLQFNVTFSVTTETHDRIKKEAELQGQAISYFMRALTKFALDQFYPLRND